MEEDVLAEKVSDALSEKVSIEHTAIGRKLLIRKIVNEVDFGQFLEVNIGLDIKWRAGDSGMTCCPLHNDDTPSFSVTLKEGGWVYHCFGCERSGTIINFYMDHYGLPFGQALTKICKDFSIKADTADLFSCMRAVRNDMKDEEKAVNTHIVASNQCRLLMRNHIGDADAIKWVLRAYEGMNKALLEHDYTFMEKVCKKAEEWDI